MALIEICAVVVFYRHKIAESDSLAMLTELAGSDNSGCRLSKIIAYDNSPDFQPPPSGPRGYEYVGDPANGGVGQAYNHALRVAKQAGCHWLLLLDQDTHVDGPFWAKTVKALSQAAVDDEVAAVVPRVRDGTRMVSPTRIYLGDIQRPVPAELSGVCPFEAAAIGSGVLIRVRFLEEVGGFDPKYWLDAADRKLFAQIWQRRRKVYVSDAVLDHELSIFDFDNRVSEDRYRDILKYEWMFQKECKQRRDHWVLLPRLLFRSAKLLIAARNKQYATITFRHFFTVLSVCLRGTGEVRVP
jgi:GT2 family glycosyltransferase